MPKAPVEHTSERPSSMILAGDREETCTLYSSFVRNFEIIEAVASSATPMTLEAATAATGMPKSTVHRLLRNLASSRILMAEANGRSFSSVTDFYSLLSAVASNSSLHRKRREIIMRLVDRVGHTCNFTTLAANDVVYVDRVEADWPTSISLFPGSHVPIHCTSSGQAASELSSGAPTAAPSVPLCTRNRFAQLSR